MGDGGNIHGGDRVPATDDATRRGCAVAGGIARFAGSLVEMPAVRASSLTLAEAGRVSTALADAWNLAAFAPVGACVLAVVDAAGGRIEVYDGAGGWGARERGAQAASPAGRVRASWGAPPGRRVAAMGSVPGPGGSVVRASCGLVLRLPAGAVGGPLDTAATLVFHAAMYAAERGALPADRALRAALDVMEMELQPPSRPRGRVAWADAVVDRLVDELGGIGGPADTGSALRDHDPHV